MARPTAASYHAATLLFLMDIPGAIDFVSTNSVPALLLVAVRVKSDRAASESDSRGGATPCRLHARQTKVTYSVVERDLLHALKVEPATAWVM